MTRSLLAGTLFLTSPLAFSATTINFEGLPDSTVLSNQYATDGVTFTNAIILTSGLSLNEFEFPPHSGVNVASDSGGAMSILFSSPQTSISGYFTYLTKLTLDAYGTGGMLLEAVHSPFNSNQALSGDPGSQQNENLTLSSTAGIRSLVITGLASGASFTLDDLSFSPKSGGGTGVPEPSPLVLWGAVLVALTLIHLLRQVSCERNFIRSCS